ncbi:MAG: hypothetical protein WCI04_06600 [archaeon]
MKNFHFDYLHNCKKVDETVYTSEMPYHESTILDLKRNGFGLIFSVVPMDSKLSDFATKNGIRVKIVPSELRSLQFRNTSAIKSFFKSILCEQRLGRKVLIHCSVGNDAAPFITNLYALGKGIEPTVLIGRRFQFRTLLGNSNLGEIFERAKSEVKTEAKNNGGVFRGIASSEKLIGQGKVKTRLILSERKQSLRFSPQKSVSMRNKPKLRRLWDRSI